MSGTARARAAGSSPARAPHYRPAKVARPKRSEKYRPLAYHRDRQGRPKAREKVVEKMLESKRFAMIHDRYRPFMCRICRGKVQMAIVMTIIRYTFGEYGKPKYTMRPILDRDFAFENGLSIEGVRDHLEDLIARGVISRKGAEGEDFFLYRCNVQDWAEIQAVPAEREKRDDVVLRSTPVDPSEVDDDSGVTGKKDGEEKKNAHGVTTPLAPTSQQLRLVLEAPADPKPVGDLVPLGNIVAREATTAHLHWRSKVSCQTCHSRVPVGARTEMLADGMVIINVVSTTDLDRRVESVDLKALSTGLVERGYTYLAAEIRDIVFRLEATPLNSFWSKLHHRNHLQNGRLKPESQRLPKGAMLGPNGFAAKVAEEYRLEQSVLGVHERAQKEADEARARQFELDQEYTDWRDEQVAALFDALPENDKVSRRKAKLAEIKRQFPNLVKPAEMVDQYIRRDLALEVKPFDQWLASRRR